MTNISATMVKELREMTGAGMMDCKKALAETSGDLETAVDLLRKKGLAKAAKKAGRTAAEGLIGVATRAGVGALVEVNSETDFVARNPEFQAFVRACSERALETGGDLDALLVSKLEGGESVAVTVSNLIAKIGENIVIRRFVRFELGEGIEKKKEDFAAEVAAQLK